MGKILYSLNYEQRAFYHCWKVNRYFRVNFSNFYIRRGWIIELKLILQIDTVNRDIASPIDKKKSIYCNIERTIFSESNKISLYMYVCVISVQLYIYIE